MSYFSKKRPSIFLSTVYFTLLIASISFGFGGCTMQSSQPDGNKSKSNTSQDIGHLTLPKNDGWAASETGTTGGANATSKDIYLVTSRKELVQALGSDKAPKIIYIKGTINANEDDAGKQLTCDDYATDGYTLAAYLKAYDPAVWGRTKVPTGSMEAARVASYHKQDARVTILIPSNTTIVGADTGASVIGANFMIKNANNVIIRNIQFENAFDCFPQWDPTDGTNGNWNSQYDNVSIVGSQHVWIDHNSFTDANHLDAQEPKYFDRFYEQHDGQLDITKGADLVTVSWNHFSNHDKTMLIGGQDTSAVDVGKLRITIHHNYFENTGQRLPRVRFGQVHIYNNYYNETANSAFLYALGVGVSSQIFAQNNVYLLPKTMTAASIIKSYNGTAVHSEGDMINGKPVDLLAAYNTVNSPHLGNTVNWIPQFYLPVTSSSLVPDLVSGNAGSGHSIAVLQSGK